MLTREEQVWLSAMHTAAMIAALGRPNVVGDVSALAADIVRRFEGRFGPLAAPGGGSPETRAELPPLTAIGAKIDQRATGTEADTEIAAALRIRSVL